MVIITKITTQKKQSDRYNVYVNDGDGEKYAFSVDEDVLIKYSLKKGLELDEFTQFEVLYQDTVRKALSIAIQYLALRMRSEKEVKDYLKLKDIEDPVIQEVIHRLYNLKYINDNEFAIAYVRTQINTTDKGPNVVKMELKEKGIETMIVDHVMEEFSYNLQLSKVLKLCQKALNKKRNDSQYIFEQKLKQALLRKGYTLSVIDEALREWKKDMNDETGDHEAIIKQGEKAIKNYGDNKQKVKQFLYRKGFSMDEIEDYLNRLEH
ncbi:recombination regulator RecX [Bacillus sp. CGMCC 1.16607]|uniref:recombination regulator RecX n=1 Tax=Bacillus sp. CGMCC 1.16607 TaxID=3351842 RepID=UPI003626DC2E